MGFLGFLEWERGWDFWIPGRGFLGFLGLAWKNPALLNPAWADNSEGSDALGGSGLLSLIPLWEKHGILEEISQRGSHYPWVGSVVPNPDCFSPFFGVFCLL